ncbi:MAG: hypothetical protein U0412_11635 [Nitrospira sp.]
MLHATIASLWDAHRGEGWPTLTTPSQGQLMTLDTVISGCVVFFLDSPDGLDSQRVAIIQDCLADLDDLMDELDSESKPYFLRLRHLGTLLIETAPAA